MGNFNEDDDKEVKRAIEMSDVSGYILGSVFNILFPTIIVVILFSLYDILIFSGVIEGVQQSFLGAWDDINWSKDDIIPNFHWCVSMTVFKTILYYAPLLIFLALVSYFAKVEPALIKKFMIY